MTEPEVDTAAHDAPRRGAGPRSRADYDKLKGSDVVIAGTLDGPFGEDAAASGLIPTKGSSCASTVWVRGGA